MPVLDNLENEFFLGKRCIAGDDGRLTWLVLASGYTTVHQSSAKAISMFPSSFKAFVKQHRPVVDIDTVATGEHWLATFAVRMLEARAEP